MALLRLQPDQISKHWGLVRWAAEASMPPTTKLTDVFFVRILQALLAGRMQCWVVLEKITAQKVNGIIITEISGNPYDGTKSLIVFAGATFEPEVSVKEWKGGFASLVKFARANGCRSVAAYTANTKLMEMFKRLGLSMEYVYAVLDV